MLRKKVRNAIYFKGLIVINPINSIMSFLPISTPIVLSHLWRVVKFATKYKFRLE